MNKLFYFLYRYRVFLVFLFIETISLGFFLQEDSYLGIKFFNTSNSVVGFMVSMKKRAQEYFVLKEINDELASTNARLLTMLSEQRQYTNDLLMVENQDTVVAKAFHYIEAKVVNNSMSGFKNHITINAGLSRQIAPGMAVLSASGVVGKIKAVSRHYAVAVSVLNIDTYISSVIKSSNHFGTIKWLGDDSRHVAMMYIPRHAYPLIGDTIVTSSFNAIYPPDVTIGYITEVALKDEEPFYDIRVKLSQDFTKLNFVYVVKSLLKHEKDSLENETEKYF